MIDTILLGLIVIIGLSLTSIGLKIIKKLDSLKNENNPLNSDISLIDEVINYIASKGLEPTIGNTDSGTQYFAYTKNDMIMNIIPIEDIEYKKDSLAWKARRSELFKAIDKYLEENN